MVSSPEPSPTLMPAMKKDWIAGGRRRAPRVALIRLLAKHARGRSGTKPPSHSNSWTAYCGSPGRGHESQLRAAARLADARDFAASRFIVRGAFPLQRLAIPVRQLRRRCVGLLQKSQQELVGVACPMHGVVRQNELPESLVVEGVRRGEAGAAVAGRLRISVDIERRAAV